MQLTKEQKIRVSVAINRVLWLARPEVNEQEWRATSIDSAESEDRIDQLVNIVRQTTAKRIEPYLFQILEDICPRCPAQYPNGWCLLRVLNKCALYSCAAEIVTAIAEELKAISDPEYLSIHGDRALLPQLREWTNGHEPSD
jgi:hypothetical protein